MSRVLCTPVFTSSMASAFPYRTSLVVPTKSGASSRPIVAGSFWTIAVAHSRSNCAISLGTACAGAVAVVAGGVAADLLSLESRPSTGAHSRRTRETAFDHPGT